MKDFSLILKKCKENKEKKTPVIVCAEENELIKSICKCLNENLINKPILIGDKNKICKMLSQNNKSSDDFKIINVLDKIQASEMAVQHILTGDGDFLIKGLVDTSIILKAILNKKQQLSREKNIFFSHVSVVKADGLDRLLLISDAAMNIAPDVNDKIKIIKNALIVAKGLDIINPKIAILAAKEKVSEKMKATLDAKQIVDFYHNTDLIVEGPLALDNAISKKSAEIKGISGSIKGDADILIMPNIEAGNIFYKTLTYLTNAKVAGLLIGAKVPVVITSRADSEESKFLSIVLATLI